MRIRACSILLMCFIVMVSLAACFKENGYSSENDGNGFGNVPEFTILTADNWAQDGNGFYTHVFKDVVPQGVRSIDVYLLRDGHETQINHFIFYSGGELWATYDAKDVYLTFNAHGSNTVISLKIKLVFN